MSLKEEKVIENLIKNAEQTAANFTYPIFTVGRNDKPDLIGTSVIIEVDGTVYLLTAAHVLDVATSMGMIAIGVNGQIIPINSEWVFASQLDGMEFDVAFTELNLDLVNKVQVLPSSNLLSVQPDKGEHFCFVNGFPASKISKIKH